MTPHDLHDFTEAARAFLDASAKPRTKTRFHWGEGADGVGLLPERSPEEEREDIRVAKAWKAQEFDAGFGWISGPLDYGGGGLTAAHEKAYKTLKGSYETPSEAPFAISLGMVAPTILAHGTDLVRERYLRRLWRGELIACQLFSEPGAGSDLASLQTKALPIGNDWTIDGQKVWTSGAQYSDIGEVICRTNPVAPKHRGMTAFVVDMKTSGVDVRPLRQITGGSSFNEVFFNDVVVNDQYRLGEVDGGWTVALTTLMNERAAVGGGGMGGGVAELAFLDRVFALAKVVGRAGDPTIRDAEADLYSRYRIAAWNHQRGLANIDRGQLPGPEMSIGKLLLTDNLQQLADLVSALLGPSLIADTGEWGTFAWTEFVLGVPGIRLAGGTDEVMRNILGERVLGLPREPT